MPTAPTSSEGSEKSIDTSNEQLLSTRSVFPRTHPGVGISGRIDTRNVAIKMVADRTVVCASELPHLFFFFISVPFTMHRSESRGLMLRVELFGATIIGYFRRDEKMNKQIIRERVSRERKKMEKIPRTENFSAIFGLKCATFLHKNLLYLTRWLEIVRKINVHIVYLHFRNLFRCYFQPL